MSAKAVTDPPPASQGLELIPDKPMPWESPPPKRKKNYTFEHVPNGNQSFL